jgi:hypothetical protein
MKRPPKQVRLDPEIESEVKKIAEVTNLTDIEIIRQMVRAGVLAIKNNGYKMELPLQLEVMADPAKKLSTSSAKYQEHRAEFNETKDAPQKKKGAA